MDSSRKRRAVDETPTTGSATKKLKLLNSNPAPVPQQPSAETVQKVGLKLIGQINNATDKTGRTISDAFIDLPDRVDFHDYYVQTKMPISVSMVEDKIRRNGYATITEIESDLKRMVQNAKEYNMPKSDIYEDAERIRKLVYNYMKIHNPAYTLDPNYQSFCTPIPETKITLTNGGAHSAGNVKAEPGSRGGSSKPRASLGPKASEPPSERKSSAAPSASAAEGEDQVDADVDDTGNRDFTGKTFQEAQQMIVAELISHAEDGVEIFTPFVTLPSRKLEDYYKTIRHPVSLKSVQKRTRGIHGRAPPTGRTDFKTWDAFEEEISFIWRNAREYNLDGSEMYELAGEFEEYFKAQLAEAKSKVEEPAARITLAAPKKSGITLNLGQHRSSPTPGVSVDNEALARQRQMVQAGVNGQQTQAKPTPPVNGATRPPSQGMQDARPSSSAQALPPASAPVKNERVSTMSPAATMAPAVQAIPNGHTNGMMPPPLQRHMSGSPYPAQPTMAPPVTSFHFTAPSALPPTPIREYPISQSLLPVVTLSTHPQLRLQKPYSLAVPPHASLSQQSRTITLPSTHYYVQIAPTISRELSMGRAYKMFVTVNGTRLTQRDTQFHADSGKRTHMYEGSLASGVNRIEVEVAAAKVDGDGKGLDVEKVTIFANLTR